ncbi:bifunctional polymyxin resistance protein, ArnA [Artemisia annua]|uniref:Bifunctional polymyxin resistance protein, ArnA n=1 Tax=Artemisia annua TaxID=35608 RepID=A0A2U1PNE4_ARTAN|nr:bifunctional polymyxin resistance protein, ArnA [Artemisia annua]
MWVYVFVITSNFNIEKNTPNVTFPVRRVRPDPVGICDLPFHPISSEVVGGVGGIHSVMVVLLAMIHGINFAIGTIIVAIWVLCIKYRFMDLGFHFQSWCFGGVVGYDPWYKLCDCCCLENEEDPVKKLNLKSPDCYMFILQKNQTNNGKICLYLSFICCNLEFLPVFVLVSLEDASTMLELKGKVGITEVGYGEERYWWGELGIFYYFSNIVDRLWVVWMIHGDKALKMLNEFQAVIRSEQGVVAAMERTRRQFYGIQYHSGFLASSLIKRLLLSGYHVVPTVRDPGNVTKVAHLWNLQRAKERLRLVKTELTEDRMFDNAIMGCDRGELINSTCRNDQLALQACLQSINPAWKYSGTGAGQLNLWRPVTKVLLVGGRTTPSSYSSAKPTQETSSSKSYISRKTHCYVFSIVRATHETNNLLIYNVKNLDLVK